MSHTAATEVEICAGDPASVMTAFLAGATRVEICSALPLGGLTPPQSFLELTAGVSPAFRRHVLIRPRPGDFLYTDSEMDTMLADIRGYGIDKADGYVIGALRPDGTVDCARVKALMDCASNNGSAGKSFTFHRAFDMVADPFDALEDIIALGFDRVLTSGCAHTAEEGIPVLRRLNEQAAGRIIIMAGGGINASNARRIMDETGIRSLHASCSSRVGSAMEFRNPHAMMGAGCIDEYGYMTTSRERVEALVKAVFSR